jgi:hypothetical protein
LKDSSEAPSENRQIAQTIDAKSVRTRGEPANLFPENSRRVSFRHARYIRMGGVIFSPSF